MTQNTEQNMAPVIEKKRLLSIDALRGFDMFWILGGEKLFAALFMISGWSFFQVAAEQMEHSSWHGFTAYDLIFPLFIFLSGVSLGIGAKPLTSYPADKAQSIVRHGYKRLFLLIFFGVLYNHGWGTGIPMALDEIRYASVLGRIGISWFVAAMLVWYVSVRNQWLVAIVILITYWLLLQFVTLDGLGGGNFSAEGALNVWFDQHLLPGITYRQLPMDPEGLLSNLPSIVNALAGVFTGRFIIKHRTNGGFLISRLCLIAIGLLLLGYAWDLIFPINKSLWTSSFVLVTVGYSMLLLTLFYFLIDVLGSHLWAKCLAVIGMNSIIIYLASSLVNWQYSSQSLFGGLISVLPAGWQQLTLYGGMLLLQWLFLYWLYCRKIFIKV
ncbi:DUF5009 domain-containing protein [Thalassotalea insulae]|uniref:DUF5009 domain-containing protein n=1 Tax=Thalassotalea insulae TaxID=2056778 RepID=A0ABQ6GPI8_9GAMM|nr:DUF5009 domain-containing protein [Thalassotalea insulae]GLX77847.1 DUF5009 domain-containing protein [Thalassotalea insulae]